jgi:hypothetical protein
LEINKKLTAELAKAKQHDLTTAVIAKDIDLANENAALKVEVERLKGILGNWAELEIALSDRDRWREMCGKLAACIYTQDQVELRFNDCWENKWALTPTHQYFFWALQNDKGEIIFSFHNGFNALKAYDAMGEK